MVVRDAGATERLSVDRYDMMRSGQRDSQPVPSSVLRINEAAMLPALAPQPGVVVNDLTPAPADPAVVIVPKP